MGDDAPDSWPKKAGLGAFLLGVGVWWTAKGHRQQAPTRRRSEWKRRSRSAYMDIVERRALDDNLYRVTIAANESIRQPPDLDFGGLSTDNYGKNPVVMWAHDVVGRSPAGRAAHRADAEAVQGVRRQGPLRTSSS